MPRLGDDGKLIFKIVFWGPSIGGKTRAIRWLYEQEKQKEQSQKRIIKNDEQTLFFDRNILTFKGFKFEAFTIAGQRRHKYQRKVVLKGADGIIFVWNGLISEKNNNIFYLKELMTFISSKIHNEIPLIVMLNFSDRSDIVSIEEVREIFNSAKLGMQPTKDALITGSDDVEPISIFKTVAIKGVNIQEAFNECAHRIILKYQHDQEKAEKISKKHEAQEDNPIKILNDGIYLFEDGKWWQSTKNFDQALKLFKNLKDQEGEASCYRHLGQSYKSMGYWEKALNNYHIALELVKKLDDKKGELDCLINIGSTLDSMGRWDDALFHLEKGLQLSRNLNDKKGEALCLINIGNILRQKGSWEEALNYAEKSLEISKKSDDPRSESKSLINLGLFLEYIGRGREAIDYYKKSHEIYEKLNDLHGELTSIIHIGSALELIERREVALTYNRRGLEIAREIGDKWAEIACLINIGITLRNKGLPKEALEYHKRSLEISREIKDKKSELKSLINIGITHDALDNPKEALNYTQTALNIAKGMGDIFGESNCLMNLGINYKKLGLYKEAIEHLRQAIVINESIIEETLREDIRINIKAQLSKVIDQLLEILLISLQNKKDIKYNDLIELLCEAEYFKCREVSNKLEIKTSETSCEKGKNILDEIEKLRYDLIKVRRKIDILRERITIDRTAPIEYDDQKEAFEKKRLDLIRELEKATIRYHELCPEPGSITLPYSKRIKIFDNFHEILKRMHYNKVNVAILEFIHAGTRLGVILIHSDDTIVGGFKELTEEDLSKLTNLYWEVLNSLKLAQENPENEMVLIKKAETSLDILSNEMYSALIPKTISKVLHEKSPEYLVIIPHKQLHLFPFAILNDGKGYWGSRFGLSKSFSLDLLRISLKKEESVKKEHTFYPLFVANPNNNDYIRFGNEEPIPLSLPLASEEVKCIEKIHKFIGITKMEVLWHEKATEKNFMNLVNNYKIDLIHFAGHAYWEGRDPRLSFLMFSGYPEKGGEAKLHASEIISKLRFLKNPVVVLSACESGVSKTIGGDEMFGLVRGLLIAGARSMIMSCWPVFDGPACNFMLEFYLHWLKGFPISKALMEARKIILKKSQSEEDNDLTTPLLNGGAFTIFGSPFTKVVLPKQANTDKLSTLTIKSPCLDRQRERGICIRGLPKNEKGYFEG
ncbi:MAG: tetratricopeptide repeat protein [Candidatus Helarchaeota archaeon]